MHIKLWLKSMCVPGRTTDTSMECLGRPDNGSHDTAEKASVDKDKIIGVKGIIRPSCTLTSMTAQTPLLVRSTTFKNVYTQKSNLSSFAWNKDDRDSRDWNSLCLLSYSTSADYHGKSRRLLRREDHYQIWKLWMYRSFYLDDSVLFDIKCSNQGPRYALCGHNAYAVQSGWSVQHRQGELFVCVCNKHCQGRDFPNYRGQCRNVERLPDVLPH